MKRIFVASLVIILVACCLGIKMELFVVWVERLLFNRKTINGILVTQEQCVKIRNRSGLWKPRMEDPYNDADYIIDGIYLGNVCAAHDAEWLEKNDVDILVNMASEWAEGNITYTCVEYLPYSLDDTTSQDEELTMRFINRVTGDLLRAVRRLGPNRNLLVHCNMGISRSASLVIRYMQITRHMTYDEAYNYIKKIRPVTRPNKLFEKILRGQDKMI